ncbi:hypothetical protein KM043_007802 [Ampulex compressa]|nr:hypothetical protein KM043_007802 [Ampulex compressa]
MLFCVCSATPERPRRAAGRYPLIRPFPRSSSPLRYVQRIGQSHPLAPIIRSPRIGRCVSSPRISDPRPNDDRSSTLHPSGREWGGYSGIADWVEVFGMVEEVAGRFWNVLEVSWIYGVVPKVSCFL